MTKVIPLRAAGTYYTNRSPAAGPNASLMQGLVWHAKQNRTPPVTSVWHLDHPQHPAQRAIPIGNAADAYAYAADVLLPTGAVGMASRGMPIALVPIPSSNTTRATMRTGRWPARELARQLAARGMGRLCLALAQRVETQSRKGERGKTRSLLENLEVVVAPPANELVVYVDDVVTWGEHIAAADLLLRPSGMSGAMVIGATHAVQRDAYEVIRTTIDYTPDGHGNWSVVVHDPLAGSL